MSFSEGRPVPGGFRPLDPETIGSSGSSIARETQHVSPEERARLTALAAEYQGLVEEIDRRYESGATAGVEDLEERAYALEEELETVLEAAETLEEHTELRREEQVGLEEQLANGWAEFVNADRWNDRFMVVPHHDHPEGVFTREQKLAQWVRHVAAPTIGLHGGLAAGGEFKGLPAGLSDAALVAATRDAYERRAALLERMRRPKLGLSREEIERRVRPPQQPQQPNPPRSFEPWLARASASFEPRVWTDDPLEAVLVQPFGTGELGWARDVALGFNQAEIVRPIRQGGTRPWCVVLEAGVGAPGLRVVIRPGNVRPDLS